MSENRFGTARAVILLFVLLFSVQICAATASADDAELLAALPGLWTCTVDVEKDGEAPRKTETTLVLGEDGSMSLRCSFNGGETVWTYGGTWSSKLVTEASFETGTRDRLTLLFTSTDNPSYAGSAYSAECVYYIYAESWEEENALMTALILEGPDAGGASPFADIFGSDDAALYRERGPNMRVVRCSSWVSLREKRSPSSKRRAKVPLGALVIAFPEYGEENGFLFCLYHGEYGYILTEYLQPID